MLLPSGTNFYFFKQYWHLVVHSQKSKILPIATCLNTRISLVSIMFNFQEGNCISNLQLHQEVFH